MNNKLFSTIDSRIIKTINVIGLPFARIAIFIVYFWFGILKLFELSPANPLVASLLEETIPFISFGNFIIILGLYEIIVGVVFLIPRLERVAILLLVPHLFVTAMPMIMLPEIAWQSALVPTLEGQYIIKNLLIIATALGIAAHLKPVSTKNPA